MARYVTRVRSPWSAADAFSFMADMRKFADWDPGVTTVTQLQGDGPGIGAVYDVTISTIGPDQTMRYRTTEIDEPRSLLLESHSKIIESLDRITVTATGDASGDPGCIVTYDAELNLQGPFKIGAPLLSLVFDRIGDRAAAGLCDALDGEVAT